MKFSLINVVASKNNKVSGYWVQNHIGTIESAKQKAIHTEAANSNRITVAVVEEVNTTTPMLHYFENLIKLA